MSSLYNINIILFTLLIVLCGCKFVTDRVNFEAMLSFTGVRQNWVRAHFSLIPKKAVPIFYDFLTLSNVS
jgi:hypothetical protein